MIKLLFKLGIFAVMGLVTIGGTHALLDVQSEWGRYTFNAAVPAGTAITVNHPHSTEPAHAETAVPLQGQQTLDVGSISTLTGMYVLTFMTGYLLRGRRKQFMNDCC